jgi:hypothetical protein
MEYAEDPARILTAPLRFLEDFDSVVQKVDMALKSIDGFLALFDGRLSQGPSAPERGHGRCSYCDSLAKEVSAKFGLNEAEVLNLIYGLASDDEGRVRESAERLKRLGVFEYVMLRVKELLKEVRGGR